MLSSLKGLCCFLINFFTLRSKAGKMTISMGFLLIFLTLVVLFMNGRSDLQQEEDDCSACCEVKNVDENDDQNDDVNNKKNVSLPFCCQQDLQSNLFGTRNGQCLGLPCCYYGNYLFSSLL